MSQNTSAESSTQTLPNHSINPVMQAALGSLDVELEEELARYRRQRAGHPVMSPRGLGRHQTRKPIELISVNKGGGRTQLPALGMSTAPPIMSFPLFIGNQTGTEPAPSEETTQQPMAPDAQLDALSSAASESGSPLAVSSSSSGAADDSARKENVAKPLTPPEKLADVGGDLVLLEADQSQPGDYLESSEQLLRSLAEQEGSPDTQKRTNRLLTPLGVGSILLLLLSIPTLVYILTNPSTLSALNFGRFFGSKTQTTAQKPTETTQPKYARAKDSPIVNGPNLASEEFTDLNINTLSHLETTPTPSSSPSAVSEPPNLPNPPTTSTAPAVVPNSALPTSSTNLASVLLAPSPQSGAVQPRIPQVAPLPAPRASAPGASTSNRISVANKPSSAPAALVPNKPSSAQAKAVTKNSAKSPSSAQVAPSSASSRDDFYYVILKEGGARTLNKAKTIVPDAYVRNLPQGDRIQMGAYKRESEAKTVVTQLQQQGFSASIYHP